MDVICVKAGFHWQGMFTWSLLLLTKDDLCSWI